MNSFVRIAGRFTEEASGAIAIIFGLCLTAVVVALGLAIDTATAVNASNKITAALDATSLYAAQRMSVDEDISIPEIQAAAEEFFRGQLGSYGGGMDWSNFGADLDPTTGTAKVNVDVSVRTHFARVMNVSTIDMHRASTSVFGLKEIELAMVLDVTGSMGSGSGSKLAMLKTAAKDVIDILISENAYQRNRIALAPYSATVNAGSYAGDVTGAAGPDPCVYERDGVDGTAEQPPGAGHYLGYEPNPATPENNHYACPPATILPLTDKRKTLEETIDSYQSAGWTAGHIGAAWGWYLLSPEWTSIWPSESRGKPYSDSNVLKAVILMTDGEFNTSYRNGAPNDTSSAQAIEICSAMRDKNIRVYAVAFFAPSTAEATLQACAPETAGEQRYFNADSQTELRAAFQSIAKNLQKLRLTK